MAFKFNQGRCAALMTPQSLAPKFVEIEGLMSNRGSNAVKERMSLTRDCPSRPRDTPKVQSSVKAPRSVQASLGVQTRIRPFNQSDSSDDVRARCPSHPGKRVKYFLASNTNIGFCTKCAVTMSEREQLIEEQKMIKLSELDKFRAQLTAVKDFTNSKLKQLEISETVVEKQYHQELSELEQQFTSMFKTLSDKYEQLINALKERFEQARNHTSQEQEALEALCLALDNYSNDITKNYEGILNDLSLSNFEEIMKQYHRKLNEHKRQLDACQPSGIDFDHQLQLLELQKSVGRMSLPHPNNHQPSKKRQSLRARLENKENHHPNLTGDMPRKARIVR